MSELAMQGGSPIGFWQRVRGLARRIRSLLVYLSFSAAANAVGLVTTLFMVHYVVPQEVGRLAIVLGALMITNTLISFGSDNLVAIGKTNLEPGAYEGFRGSYSHFALMNFAIWQVITVLVWRAFHVDDLVLFVPLMSLTKFFVTMASIEYVIEQRAVAYGLVQFLTSLMATLVTVGLVIWVSPKAEARVAALLLADIALLAVRYGVRPRVIESWRFHREDFLRIARFGAPIMLSVGPAYLLNEGDKLIVAHQMGLASTGIYGAACTVAGVVLTFFTALQNSVIPKIMLALKSDSKRPTRTALHYSMKFGAVSIAFTAPFLLVYTLAAEYLLPARYSAAIPAVYILVVMMQWRSFYIVIGTVTDYLSMTTQKLIGCILGAAVSLTIVILLTPLFGLLGAALGGGLVTPRLAVGFYSA